MSRTSRRERRLHLFELGNDRCPICLAPFAERDVAQGKAVTLEHVPPTSFKAGGIAMCLTSTLCNNSANRVEQSAVEARREPKARIDMPGLPTQTGYVSVDVSGRIDVRMSKPRVATDAVSDVLRSRQPFTMTFTEPTAHYASIPWLKAAYLSVFSLLGVYGYRYAQGPAVERVRRQIMNPEDEIIRHFAVKAPAAWQEGDGIVMSRRQTPCWAVKMRECIVLLPRNWDMSFYDWTDGLPSPGGKLTVGGGPLWYPARFGQRRVASIAFREGSGPRRMLGEDLFGKQGRVTKGDNVTPFVVADYSDQDATVMVTHGLGENRARRAAVCLARAGSATQVENALKLPKDGERRLCSWLRKVACTFDPLQQPLPSRTCFLVRSYPPECWRTARSSGRCQRLPSRIPRSRTRRPCRHTNVAYIVGNRIVARRRRD